MRLSVAVCTSVADCFDLLDILGARLRLNLMEEMIIDFGMRDISRTIDRPGVNLVALSMTKPAVVFFWQMTRHVLHRKS